MSSVRRVYVEKKPAFAVQAKDLRHELRKYLGVSGLTGVRVLIRYDVENISDDVFEKACKTVFAEPPVDTLYKESFEMAENARTFSVEFLPGQFDQRADSAVQCVKFLNEEEEDAWVSDSEDALKELLDKQKGISYRTSIAFSSWNAFSRRAIIEV